jgi:hypothetical protein
MVLHLTDVLEQANQHVIYDLCDVILHSGSAQSGHYYSNCERYGKWFCLNDANVTTVPKASVCQDCGGTVDLEIDGDVIKDVQRSCSAYLLFYRKRSTVSQSATFQLTETNPELIGRLLPEIENAILREVAASKMFGQLLARVCQFD